MTLVSLVWLSWIERSMKSNLAFPQPCNMLSFFSLVISCIEFFIFCFQNSSSSSVTVFKETHWPLVCLITAVCVCVCSAWWKLEPCFALSAEFGSCLVWRPRAMSRSSCLFIYQLLSEIYSPLVSIDSAHHFCSPPAETESWSWSRDGDSEQQGGTRLFPLKRLKRKFADGWEIQTSDHTENIQQGNTTVMFLAVWDVSWVCVILSPVWASFP